MNPDDLLKAVLRKHGNEYEYVKYLGGGGFSNVYLIKVSKTNEEYALKIMDYDRLLQILKNKKPPDINAKLDIIKKRFIKEAAFYKTINHPNIVKIRTFDVIDDFKKGEIEIPYLITHFINGKSLKKTIEDNGPLTFKTALKISGNILSALHTIHLEGFIHRDIKPGNIMIESDTGDAILIDFGLAKDILSETTLTVSSDIIGTPAYMSPEQSRGLKGLDYKTDIYSFGVVLYEMLTGERPSIDGVGFNPYLPPGIENILAKAMEIDPRNRYKDAEEFLNSLKELEKGIPGSDKEETEKIEPLGKPKRKWSDYLLFTLITIFIVAAAFFIIINPLGIGKKGLNIDNQYLTHITSARQFIQAGDLEKAGSWLEKAKKIKDTPEIKELSQQIAIERMKKDLDALENFLKGDAAADDKIVECRKFLDKNENIPQNDETKSIISRVNEYINELKGQTTRQYEKHIADAEEYLKKGEFNKAYDIVKIAKNLGETQKTSELENRIFIGSVSASQAYCEEAKPLEAEENYLLAKAIKPDSNLRNLEKRIEFLKSMPEDVRAVYKKGNKIEQNNQKYWEAEFRDGIVMVYIPAGKYIIAGSSTFIPGYWVGKTEVSVGQYMKFVNETFSHYPEWREKRSPYNIETGRDNYYRNQVDDNFPIVGISWENAAAYCQWLSGKTGLKLKLPSEAQWEKAARWTDARLYPWGSEKPGNHLANFFSPSRKTVKVDANPQGASPYGLLNMAGNVEEWCDNQVARGGSFYDHKNFIKCTSRKRYDSSERTNSLGFRLCMVNR